MNRWTVFPALFLSAALLTACGSEPQATPSHKTQSPVVVHADKPVFLKLSDLTKESDAVFIGTVEGIAGTRNTSRDPQDPSKEDSEIYIESVDYRIRVTEFLKGNGDAQLLFTQTKMRKMGRESVEIENDSYIPLEQGDTFVFFAKKSPTGHYYGSGDPFLFSIRQDSVAVKSKDAKLMEFFKPTELKTFRNEVLSFN